MRGRAISVLLVLLSTTLPAFSDCNWTPRYSGQFRSTVYDVAVDGEGFVWLATGYGVQLLERNGSRGYAVVGSIAVPGSTRTIALNGSDAYVGSGSRVYVVRRSGGKLSLGNSIDTGGTVNDVVVYGPYLFAAMSNGIAHIELIELRRTSVTLFTSRENVTSLAILGSTMYAADGDLSVERFTLSIPSLPQGTGSLESLARSSSVNVANGMLYVSDELGQNTDVFLNTTKLGRIPYPTNSFAPLSGNSFFAAGPQRVLRALDTTSLTRVAELYQQQLPPLGGTNNRIFAMVRSGDTLLVAAGDMGLVTYDVAGLMLTHPLISYPDGGGASALAIGEKAYFGGSSKIFESSINKQGVSLVSQRSWDSASPLLHDKTATSLLTSNNAELRVWSVDTATPAPAFTSTLASTIRAAVMTSGNIFALLDNSLWRVPLAGGEPQQVSVQGPRVVSIARAGNAIALLQVTDNANTIVRYYAAGDLTSPTKTFNVEGASLGGIALNATTAALFTFRGISLVDLASGAVRVLPDSNRTIPQQLVFTGNTLLVLGTSTLAVWDASQLVLLREHSLPSTPLDLDVATNGIAVMATGSGAMAIDYMATLPKGTQAIGSSFYSSAAAAGTSLYLLESPRIDVYWTGKGAAPSFVANIFAAGTSHIAALPQGLFVLGGSSVTSFSPRGAQLAQTTISEGVNAQSTALAAAGNAIWASFFKGCASGVCDHKTVVLDPNTLTVTATLSGGVKRVTTSGTRAYALFENPAEVRVYDIANPVQPSQIIAAPSPTNASDIAYSAGKVYVMGNKVYAYNESLLAAGESLDPSNATANLAIEGDCAVITGRAEQPQLYTTASWNASSSPQVPSLVKAIAQQPGRLLLLTDHSIEVWTTAPPPASGKRRAAN